MIEPRSELRSITVPIHGGRAALIASGSSAVHDFSTCINAFGPPDVVRRAARDANIEEYPDPASHLARAAAAKAWNLRVEELAFGAGATELIQALCIAFVRRGDDVLIETPAFGEYARSAIVCGARVQRVSASSDALISRIALVRPRVVFLCSPTSPLGVASDRARIVEVARACAAIDALLVLDQSYDAFSTVPLGTPAVDLSLPVVHLRSLTKEFAIAGLRAAFAVAGAGLIAAIETARVTWAASGPAQAAAIACFDDDAIDHARTTIQALRAETARLRDACRAIGLATFPSTTHYFVIDVRNAVAASGALLERGILVRDCTSFGLANAIRVAARQPDANNILIDALRASATMLLP